MVYFINFFLKNQTKFCSRFHFHFIFAGSPTKSPKKFSTTTINGGNGKNGSRLILNHHNNKKETSFNNVPTVKSVFLSDEDEDGTEDDDYDLDEETDVFPGDHFNSNNHTATF